MKKSVIVLFVLINVVLFSKEKKTVELPEIDRKSEIEYSHKGIMESEIVKNSSGDVLYYIDYLKYDINGLPLKAKISDMNNIYTGYFLFDYSESGELIKAKQFNIYDKIVKISNFVNKGKKVDKTDIDASGKIIDRVEYKLGEQIEITSREKKTLGNSVIKNGVNYDTIIKYDEIGKIYEEILKDKDGNLVMRYSFFEYNENMYPLKARVFDENDKLIGVMNFIYDKESRLIKFEQYSSKGELIAISTLNEKDGKLHERMKNSSGEIVKKKEYRFENFVSIVERTQIDLIENFIRNNSRLKEKLVYDLDKRIKEEIRYSKGGDELIRFEFIEYDKLKRAKKAKIFAKGKEIGYFEFNYDRDGKLSDAKQLDLNGKLVKESLFLNNDGKKIESARDSKGREFKRVEYDFEGSLKIIDMKNVEYYEARWIEELNKKDENIKRVLKLEKRNSLLKLQIEDLVRDLEIEKKYKNPQIIKHYNSEDEKKLFGKKIKDIRGFNDSDIIAITEIELSSREVNSKDTLIAELITDAIKDYTKVDIVMINGGTISEGIAKGEIEYSDIKRVLVNRDKLYFIELSGKDIRALLKKINKITAGSGNYLNTYGLTWESSKEFVRNIRVGGAVINPYKTYSIACNDYIAKGNGIYSSVMREKLISSNLEIAILFGNYIKKIGTVDEEYILEKRHIILN